LCIANCGCKNLQQQACDGGCASEVAGGGSYCHGKCDNAADEQVLRGLKYTVYQMRAGNRNRAQKVLKTAIPIPEKLDRHIRDSCARGGAKYVLT
jgi:hypothetical protein